MLRQSYRSRVLVQFTRSYEKARNLFNADQLLDSDKESLDLEVTKRAKQIDCNKEN